MAPQLRRLLPNKGLSWSQGDVVLGKTRRDTSVVDTLARVMPLDKQNVRGFLLKMVEFALGMGRWLVEQHEESCAPPETVVEIDPFWVFQEMHMHFTHEMGWENEMDYALFISLFQELMYARERYRNWWDSTPVSYNLFCKKIKRKIRKREFCAWMMNQVVKILCREPAPCRVTG